MLLSTAKKHGIKEGRLQIIMDIKRHYDESYSESPMNIGDCLISVPFPETTLYQYFKEIPRKRGVTEEELNASKR